MTMNTHTTLVLGGTGRVGRRIVRRLVERGVDVRVGSRAGDPPFDWSDPTTWPGAVAGVRSAYLMYHPEIEWPGAAEAVGAVARSALDAGVERLVLLSARNQDEARRCEDAVTGLPVEATVLAPSSFHQNFDEGVFLDPLRGGVLALPAGGNADPFVDADDIADVAVAALTEDGHAGQRYELTGPRAFGFPEATELIARATGRPITYRQVSPAEYTATLVGSGLDEQLAQEITAMYGLIETGKISETTDGVAAVLGRAPRTVEDYVVRVAATGAWNGEDR